MSNTEKKPYCTKKVAVIFIIKQGNKYLFQKRTNTGAQDGWYMMPGGHVDEGEKVIPAAIREAKEELDITIEPQGLIFRMVKPEKNHISFFFEVVKYTGTITNNEPEKHGDLQFLLPTHPQIYPSIAQEIQAIASHQYFLEGIDY